MPALPVINDKEEPDMNRLQFHQFDLATPEYDQNFWDALRRRQFDPAYLDKGRMPNTDVWRLPDGDNNKFLSYLKAESLFRRIGTVITLGIGDHKILAKDCDDLADWYAEGEAIPIYDGIRDFTVSGIGSHKLASFVKFDEEFVYDAVFNFRDYLLRRFARVMGRDEERAFITGNTMKEPSGLLNPETGAEIGVSTTSLSYDDVVALFFSLEPEYRDRAMWIMNDETALLLRTLKNDAGNYIWNHSDGTILGKPVIISNFMPSAETGAMPILFGDYSYYWVVCRRPLGIRALYEKFAEHDQIGYLGVEYLDGRLVRRKALKGLKITA